MTLLIPQIPSGVAEALLPALALAKPDAMEPGDEFRHSQTIVQPTGGLPISDVLLKQLRDPIVTSARKHGFPGSRPTSFLDFELDVAEVLANWPPLWKGQGTPSGEALRNDCWTFITVVVLPDVALWRWPAKSDESGPGSRSWRGRMVGGTRNTFQRIFRRVMCLDRGEEHPDRWGLIRRLQEDDFSAILERPGLSSNREIAVCLGEEYLAMKQRLSQLTAAIRQDVYRQATKAIRAYGVVQPLDLMSAENRAHLIQDAFRRYEDEVSSISESTSDSTASGGIATDLPLGSRTTQGRKSFLRRLLDRG
jgi:hypothetical protein